MNGFKLSYHSGSFYNYNVNFLMKHLNELGYDAIELNAEKYSWEEETPHLYPNIPKTELKSIKSDLKKYKLDVSSVSAHTHLLNSDEKLRKKAIEFTKEHILIAKYLNADIVHGLSGKKPHDLNDVRAMELLADSINTIVEFAEENNVKFALEIIAGMYINNGNQFTRLKDKIEKGRLYLNLDTSNSYLTEKNLNNFIKEYKDDIIHIHLKDAKGTEESFEFPPLGEGTIDFKGLLTTLKEIDYSGFISIEYVAHIFGYENKLIDLPEKSLDFIKRLYL